MGGVSDGHADHPSIFGRVDACIGILDHRAFFGVQLQKLSRFEEHFGIRLGASDVIAVADGVEGIG